MNITKRIRNNIDSKEMLFAVLGGVLIMVCHLIQFIDSNFYYKPVIYEAVALTFVILMLFCGKKVLSVFIFTAGIVILPCTRFDLPVSFIMVMASIWLTPKAKTRRVVLYIFAVIPMMLYYHDTFAHVGIHFGHCLFVYLGESIMEKHKQTKPKLDLLDDEVVIIAQLCDGKEIKEITEFSQNTVYAKLKAARMRNGIRANWELVARYKESLE